MSASDDPTSDMASSPADRTERLIAGTSASGSDGEARVVRLLDALRSPTTPDGVREQEAVSAIAATIAASPMRLSSRRKGGLARLAGAKAAALAAAVVLAGTGAAAATGSLPDGAQRVVSDALARVHVAVPYPDDDATVTDRTTTTSRPAVGPDAAGPAAVGLCTAWTVRHTDDGAPGRSDDATAFRNLESAVAARGEAVDEYCAGVLAPSPGEDDAAPTTDPGATATPGRSGEEHGRSGEAHGPSTSTTTPAADDTTSSTSPVADPEHPSGGPPADHGGGAGSHGADGHP